MSRFIFLSELPSGAMNNIFHIILTLLSRSNRYESSSRLSATVSDISSPMYLQDAPHNHEGGECTERESANFTDTVKEEEAGN